MRIITGKARGLKLKTPKGFTTRPTSERIKESLFNVLNGMIDFDGLKVLDLFAGTGSLGLEALSRGATSAIFIDSLTIGIIADNVKRAKFDDISSIMRGDVLKLLNKLVRQDEKFDLIFCDPPYYKHLSQKVVDFINSSSLLNEGGLMTVEYGFNEKIELGQLDLLRHLSYGKTTVIDIIKKSEVKL